MPNEQSPASPLLLSVRELGKLLSISTATLWRWEAAGRIPRPVKIGGTTRWRADEIRQWIEAGCPGRREWNALIADTKNNGRPC